MRRTSVVVALVLSGCASGPSGPSAPAAPSGPSAQERAEAEASVRYLAKKRPELSPFLCGTGMDPAEFQRPDADVRWYIEAGDAEIAFKVGALGLRESAPDIIATS